MPASIPVIDLAAETAPEDCAGTLPAIRVAAESAGVLHVVNHGVPFDLITEFGARMGASGVAPDDLVLRDLALRCLAAGQWLAERVLGLYALALDLPDGIFPVDPLPYLSLSVDTVPAWPQPRDGASATWPRPVTPVLTAIARPDGVDDLRVRLASGQWTTVAPLPGAVQVFTGPVLARWTNGRLRPARHQLLPGRVRAVTQAVWCYQALGAVRAPLAPFAAPAPPRPRSARPLHPAPRHPAPPSGRVATRSGPCPAAVSAAFSPARSASVIGDRVNSEPKYGS
jgi:hypothetical protein